MKFLVHLIVMSIVALGVGFGLSYFALSDGQLLGGYKFGPWKAWPDAGSPTPDPYTLAHLSRQGRLQLGRTEGIEFIAKTDSDGEPLTTSCAYRIDGRTPVATFWTLTATDIEGRNIASSMAQPGLDSRHMVRPDDGAIVARISRNLVAGNWLEISDEGAFQIVLRLYDASVFAGLGSEVSTLPSILNEGCSS